jgi:hypothetical protein
MELMKTVITISGQEYELVHEKGVKNCCTVCALKWYCWDRGGYASPCMDFSTTDPDYYFVKVNQKKMKNVKETARNRYFDEVRRDRGSLDNYVDGFNDGFKDAIREVKAILDCQPNNLQKLECITKLIENYGNK